jgi:DNA topoisomerase IB
MSEFKTETGYFRNNKKYGRTTKLVKKITGEIVFVGIKDREVKLFGNPDVKF